MDLIKSCYYGDIETVKNELDKGADVNTKDNDGETALMNASEVWTHRDRVIATGEGVDINARDNGGDTALTEAIDSGHIDIMKLLLDNRADVNTKTDDGLTTLIKASVGALMNASRDGYTDIVLILLKELI